MAARIALDPKRVKLPFDRGICDAIGPFIVFNSTSRSWYKKFKNGHFDWTEEPRSRRLAELNDDYLLKLVEEDSKFSIHQLKQEFIAVTTQSCPFASRWKDMDIRRYG
ncbi:unnamed protein product [Haemonchus placei]|uniref:HTH CENPB-type domain-containing protein n=1 Tax=Haemonchus placei TaxID=6290 RepID=A0A0N4X4D9_HAEPC|nr:unnamed protein product [Haemonchus placei]